ncbi:unnamed protein product [Cylicocyclus nassatus]|uniref:Uncharacterized protein n=1 Tax=Cylicocyclus nassatus TaxID=53992 RepID=A0AA36H773_CYLNA|nr:unnamed protein product [Cylicocyclus nassatus]
MDTENVSFYDSIERRIERLRKDLKRVPGEISSEMTKHRISARCKEKYETFVREKVRELSGELNEVAEQCCSIEDERDRMSEAMKTLAPAVQSKADWSAVRTKLEQLCVGITQFAFKGQRRGTKSRRDIDIGTKIKFHRKGHICSDAEALKAVLKLAYDTCIEWTDFLCNTDAITKHARIEGHSIERSYNEGLQAFRREIEGLSMKELPTKSGPVGYATFEGGSLIERDGIRGRVATKVATTLLDCLTYLKNGAHTKPE